MISLNNKTNDQKVFEIKNFEVFFSNLRIFLEEFNGT